jgi:hypothetical protein
VQGPANSLIAMSLRGMCLHHRATAQQKNWSYLVVVSHTNDPWEPMSKMPITSFAQGKPRQNAILTHIPSLYVPPRPEHLRRTPAPRLPAALGLAASDPIVAPMALSTQRSAVVG